MTLTELNRAINEKFGSENRPLCTIKGKHLANSIEVKKITTESLELAEFIAKKFYLGYYKPKGSKNHIIQVDLD
jgi:hypothetical protein